MRQILLTVVTVFAWTLLTGAQEPSIISNQKSTGAFPVVSQRKVATLVTDTADFAVVRQAAADLENDLFAISGVRPKQEHRIGVSPAIVMGTLGKSRVVDAIVKAGKVDVSGLKGQWEKFIIQAVPGNKGIQALVVIGSDRRGTAYGIYELSKQLGVSPWYWWADVPVTKSNSLFVKAGACVFGPPSVQYRGIFINDEERGLGPWARKVFEPETKAMGPKTYAKIYELMLRLKANIMWPGMKGPESFYSVKGNKEMADQYAIIIGTSHHEPLLVNSSLEWNEKRDGRWQYDKNAEAMKKVMEHRVKEAAPYENMYTIGLRGHSDLGMEAEGGIDERVALMHTIFKDQRELLQKYIPKKVEQIPQAFTAYKEVLELLNNGLQVPEDAILVWPDDNYGYLHQLNSDIQKRRQGRSGVYYHLNYVGRPLSTMWLSAPSPELIRKELNKAYGNGANRFWMFNVGDIKPYEFLTSFCLEMAWRFSYNDTAYTQKYLHKWLDGVFGPQLAPQLRPLLNDYYGAAFERKPEFMGWERGEPNTPVTNTEYSLSHYGEAQRRLASLDRMATRAKELAKAVPEALQPVFFQTVYYPVLCADLTNKKTLYAQMNRTYALQQRASARRYAQLSQQAFDSINLLTKQFGEMLGGKWKNIMQLQWGLPGKMPPLDTVQLQEQAAMGIDFTGNEGKKGIGSLPALPAFNSYYKENYEVVIFNKGKQPFAWKAAPSHPWIRLSQAAGICTDESRISVSIDWAAAPKEAEATGEVVLNGAGATQKIGVQLFRPTLPADSLKNLFVEQNGVISINAAHFSRKKDKGPYRWTTLDQLGLTGQLVAIDTDTLPRISFDWYLERNAPSLEYDFYTYNQGWVDVQSFTLPTQPISLQRGCLYAVSIDNQPGKILDFSTRNRNEKWKLHVQRNAAIETCRHFLEKPGKHTLKVWLIDTDVCFDKFVINTGGLKPSYIGPLETK
ncbi:glycosyl hydrolase 115 family protein [Paraflavisolibacter sp. H34]|uniref:glycosyl hydrolase 115 family protein n=1 Tax=Huijunlia imazamoxiresistens TaxID=3127457 RepID=UPI003016D50F